ncbi:hypothetical protein IVB12_15390 [Bradyrhizobium sp. 179]|uniref:hypothetical protein n=1 Tax=Bradyrhizobium sp. 179 TaxID=2782648 RepID=UPI001FFAE8D1|nr:hypothetical protein [Bradyrhizobium sp. 179]MCK1543298.1 hypothetical protein [Bradyrhizobium sp. 179]
MALLFAKCDHQDPGAKDCVPAVLNKYHCTYCDVSWEDIWSCGCDDECPRCGKDFTPESSEEVGPCACAVL